MLTALVGWSFYINGCTYYSVTCLCRCCWEEQRQSWCLLVSASNTERQNCTQIWSLFTFSLSYDTMILVQKVKIQTPYNIQISLACAIKNESSVLQSCCLIPVPQHLAHPWRQNRHLEEVTMRMAATEVDRWHQQAWALSWNSWNFKTCPEMLWNSQIVLNFLNLSWNFQNVKWQC